MAMDGSTGIALCQLRNDHVSREKLFLRMLMDEEGSERPAEFAILRSSP